MKLQIRQVDKLALSANESLYTRAPAHAPDGAAYSDFMVLILGLRDLSRAEFSERGRRASGSVGAIPAGGIC